MQGEATVLSDRSAVATGVRRREGIVVLGMHRSGTSAFARVINLLGAQMAADVLGAGAGNERGHWEPKRLLDLHDEILAAAGSRWDDWRRVERGSIPAGQAAWFESEIKRLLLEEYSPGSLFVLKEPRLCRLNWLYAGVFTELGVRPRYILPIRNPLAVAASLNARDGMTAGYACLLWLRHVLDAEAATRASPRAFVSYENLLADWRQTMRLAGARIGVRWPRGHDDASAEIEAFLSAEEQHHAPSKWELEASPDVPEWVKDAYRACRELEQDPDSERAIGSLRTISDAFESAAPVFAAAMFDELAVRERAFERARAADAEAAQAEQSAAVADAVASHERIITAFGETIAERATEAAELRGRVALLARERDEARRALSDAETQVASLDEAASLHRRDVETLRSRLSETSGQLERWRADARAARFDLARADAAAEAAKTELRDAAAAHEAAAAEAAALAARLAGSEAACEAGRLEAARLRGELAARGGRDSEEGEEAEAQPASGAAGDEEAVVRAPASSAARIGLPAADLARQPGEPVLSIVVPCYNQGGFVGDALSIIREERNLAYEIIVVNDGSTAPQTLRALADLEGEPHLSIIHRANGGLSSARNAGLRAARGEFVIFLDADDVLAPGLSERVNIARSEGKDVTIFDYVIANDHINYFERPSPYTIGADMLTLEDFKYKWERGLSVPIHCAIFRRDRIRTPFNEKLHAKEDWCFWVANFQEGMTAAYYPQLQAIYRQTPSNMTKDVSRMMQSWLLAAKHLADNVVEDSADFLSRSMKHVEKYYVPVLQWQARQAPPAATFFGLAAQRARLHWRESPSKLHAMARIGVGACKATARLLGRAVGRVGSNVAGAPAQIAHTTRRVHFAVRRTSPDRAARFTVVVPVFNHAAYLSGCLTSLTDQRLRPLEIIAVDDASTDPKVREILSIYERGSPSLFNNIYNSRNLGISESMNRAVAQAKGDWIALVDCDDSLRLDALQMAGRAIRRRGDIGYVFSDRMRMDQVSGRNYVEVFGGRPDLLSKPFPEALRESMVASHLKIIRRDVYLALNGCDREFDGVQDWDFAIRAMNRGIRFGYIPEPIYNYRWHGQSVSLSAAIAQWRLANRVRAFRMFSSDRRPPAPAELRRLLGAQSRVGVAVQGGAVPIADGADCWRFSSIVFNVKGSGDLDQIKLLRRRGYDGVVSAVITAPYDPFLAGPFREMSGFLDSIVAEDPGWLVALAPVAPQAGHVVLHR
jgi:glycosyltransferase involved in cell wall biosynthesis